MPQSPEIYVNQEEYEVEKFRYNDDLRKAVEFLLQCPSYLEQPVLQDQQGLEEQHGIQRRTTIISAIKMTDALADKAEVEGGLNLTQQMVRGHEFFERDHLQFVLLGGRVFEHIGHH